MAGIFNKAYDQADRMLNGSGLSSIVYRQGAGRIVTDTWNRIPNYMKQYGKGIVNKILYETTGKKLSDTTREDLTKGEVAALEEAMSEAIVTGKGEFKGFGTTHKDWASSMAKEGVGGSSRKDIEALVGGATVSWNPETGEYEINDAYDFKDYGWTLPEILQGKAFPSNPLFGIALGLGHKLVGEAKDEKYWDPTFKGKEQGIYRNAITGKIETGLENPGKFRTRHVPYPGALKTRIGISPQKLQDISEKHNFFGVEDRNLSGLEGYSEETSPSGVTTSFIDDMAIDTTSGLKHGGQTMPGGLSSITYRNDGGDLSGWDMGDWAEEQMAADTGSRGGDVLTTEHFAPVASNSSNMTDWSWGGDILGGGLLASKASNKKDPGADESVRSQLERFLIQKHNQPKGLSLANRLNRGDKLSTFDAEEQEELKDFIYPKYGIYGEHQIIPPLGGKLDLNIKDLEGFNIRPDHSTPLKIGENIIFQSMRDLMSGRSNLSKREQEQKVKNDIIEHVLNQPSFGSRDWEKRGLPALQKEAKKLNPKVPDVIGSTIDPSMVRKAWNEEAVNVKKQADKIFDDWMFRQEMNKLDVEELATGGQTMPRGLSGINKSININGQPHSLAWINPGEASALKAMGGSGKPGPMGIPSYQWGDYPDESYEDQPESDFMSVDEQISSYMDEGGADIMGGITSLDASRAGLADRYTSQEDRDRLPYTVRYEDLDNPGYPVTDVNRVDRILTPIEKIEERLRRGDANISYTDYELGGMGGYSKDQISDFKKSREKRDYGDEDEYQRLYNDSRLNIYKTELINRLGGPGMEAYMRSMGPAGLREMISKWETGYDFGGPMGTMEGIQRAMAESYSDPLKKLIKEDKAIEEYNIDEDKYGMGPGTPEDYARFNAMDIGKIQAPEVEAAKTGFQGILDNVLNFMGSLPAGKEPQYTTTQLIKSEVEKIGGEYTPVDRDPSAIGGLVNYLVPSFLSNLMGGDSIGTITKGGITFNVSEDGTVTPIDNYYSPDEGPDPVTRKPRPIRKASISEEVDKPLTGIAKLIASIKDKKHLLPQFKNIVAAGFSEQEAADMLGVPLADMLDASSDTFIT